MKRVVLSIVMCLGFIVLSTAAGWASPALITDLRYWLAPDHIQTIISFDRAVKPSYHHRLAPARFVLEIPACKSVHGNYAIPVNDVTLKQIRVQRLKNGTTQVVFDLSQEVEASIQTLKSFDGQPDRVIVNLFDPQNEEQNQHQRAERHRITKELKQEQHHIVVLDPGHGGRDPGAVGQSKLKEKEVVLDLARRIKKIVAQEAPSITIYLTRDDDYFLALPKRTEIAREYNADLFISLHANANPSRRARGFSVYTLSEKATDGAARALAEKENAADLMFGGMHTPLPTKDSLLTYVLADLSTTAALQHSLEFGHIALDNTISNLRKYKIRKEGLRRANFIVLRSADMPSVLVEACYITNTREEALLKRKDFRTKLAQALAKSIIEYFEQMQNSMKPQVVQLRKQVAALPPTKDTTRQQSPDYKMHVVRSGESLSVIAGKYEVNLPLLCQVNRISSADRIYVGQRLWIP